jgi:hypothetical protein
MRHSQSRAISFVIFAALISAPLTAIAPATVAAELPLSDAQLDKINGWIAQGGSNVGVNKISTDILGLTKNDESISARALAVKDPDNDGEIHLIGTLPDGKGYLEEHFHQDKAEIYWADKDLVLISASNGVRGGRPAEMSFTEAQTEFAGELAWWGKFADTH